MATAKEVLDRVFSKARVKRAGVSLTDDTMMPIDLLDNGDRVGPHPDHRSS